MVIQALRDTLPKWVTGLILGLLIRLAAKPSATT